MDVKDSLSLNIVMQTTVNGMVYFFFAIFLFTYPTISYKSFKSHCNTCEISINCGALGWVVFVHHRLIVIFDTPSCSAK